MLHFKNPSTGEVFAYESQDERDAFGLPELVEMSEAEVSAHFNPPPTPADPKWVGVEFEGVMCSATRDDQNGLTSVLVVYQLEGQAFQPTRFSFANGNSLVLTKDNLMPFLQVWKPFRQSFFTPEA